MPTSIIKAMPSSSQAHGTLMNLVATGWALTSAFAGLFVICYLLSFVWPTSGLAHGWMGPVATHPDNFARTFVGGVVASAAAAWLTAVLCVPVYNRLIGC
jgi:hypothetical protein